MYYILCLMRNYFWGMILGPMDFKVIEAPQHDERETFIMGEWNRVSGVVYYNLAEAEKERDRLWVTNNGPIRVILVGMLKPGLIKLRYKSMKADGLSFWTKT